MNKLLKIVGITSLLLLCTTGCNIVSGSGNGLKYDTEEVSDYVKTQKNNLQTYQYDKDQIHINVDMNVQNLKLTGGTASLVSYLDSLDALEDQYITTEWTETVSECYDEDGEDQKAYEYILGKNEQAEKMISVNPLFLDMEMDADAIEKVNASFRLNGTDQENEELYKIDKALSFGSITDAVGRAVQQLGGAGIELGMLSYNYYVLESGMMKDQEWMVDNNNEPVELNIKWDECDNYYKVYARQSFEGLPVYYTNSELGEGLSNACMPIQMLLGKDGICEVNLEKIFIMQGGNEELSLLDTSQIINNLIAVYSQGIFQTDYYIEHAELMYYAKKIGINQYSLIPVWIFEIEQEQNGERVLSQIMMFDATTGEEVSTE